MERGGECKLVGMTMTQELSRMASGMTAAAALCILRTKGYVYVNVAAGEAGWTKLTAKRCFG